MIDQYGDFLRVTPCSAWLILAGVLSIGIILGLLGGFFIGRAWQKRKDPETEQKYLEAIKSNGVQACHIHDLNVFVKSVELAKNHLDETMRSKK